MAKTKKEYRQQYKNLRQAISAEQKAQFDQDILGQLAQFDWEAVNVVHTYLSIEKFQEPDTLRFVTYLRDHYPALKIVISKSDFHLNKMTPYLWDDRVVLVENNWGILEPVEGEIIKENTIDVVIIPLLVADERGNRVGYGKGFYDRFLSTCKPSVQKIGLSYFDPVHCIEDVDDWDIPIDMMITPSKTFYFK